MLGMSVRNRSIKFANMVLAAVAAGLVVLLVQLFVEHHEATEDLSGRGQVLAQNETPRRGNESSARINKLMPDPTQFQIIIDRDPFHVPQDSTMTVPVKAVPPPPVLSQQSAVPTPKPPLPPLSVTLLGTIVIGESRKAILKDGKQEDIYSVGQAVGGGLLVRVDDDQVVIARGDEQTPLRLKSALDSGMLPVAALPALGAGQSEKLATMNMNQKAGMAIRPVLATPAMARYPQFVRQPKDD